MLLLLIPCHDLKVPFPSHFLSLPAVMQKALEDAEAQSLALKRLQDELNALRSQHQDSQEALARAKKELEAMGGKAGSAEEAVAKAAAEAEGLRAQLAALERERDALKGERDGLKGERDGLAGKHGASEEALKKALEDLAAKEAEAARLKVRGQGVEGRVGQGSQGGRGGGQDSKGGRETNEGVAGR